ncbi:MAG TPA: hypothetical protein VFE62_03470 [Gemmataceae bacterium]|nr:hypothetical protein [Gemmataceae bacterium]
MALAVRRLAWILGTTLFACLAGCWGGSQNPSYFPYLLPSGDVIKTHAKPIGPGYYANFDPHAVDLAVEPQTMTSQVGSQVVILATVRDEKGVPRRQRRVEWKVTNGNLIEVDEAGCLPGRGGVEGNSAWSFTAHDENRISRGNANKADDIMVRPGQTWCVVSSPVEGDTHVQVVVPGIFNWDKRMKTTVVRWVDAVWEFPSRAVAKFGTEHEFVTKIAKFTTREPLAKYRVRYKIIDGPPAAFLPSRAQEQVAISDLSGLAKVKIAQLSPASGVNRVSVEIIRPPDPTTPSGSGVSIVTGETSIEWLAPDVKLAHSGPPSAAVNQNVTYTTTVRNEGRVDSQFVELTLPVPDGMEFVSSNPPSQVKNNALFFAFAPMTVGQTYTAMTTFRARQAGNVKSIALMKTAEGVTAQAEANTLITAPGLKVELQAPKTGFVNAPVTYSINLTNTGSGDLGEVKIMAQFDPGLEHDTIKNPANDPKLNLLTSSINGLKAGETVKAESLTLTPRRAGQFSVRVTATGGGLQAQDQHILTVSQPKVSIDVQGPDKRYVGRPAEYRIIVKNDGDVDQTGIVVRDKLPPELAFKIASNGGTYAAGEVTWNVGTLRPGQQVALDLVTECQKATPVAQLVTSITADGNYREDRVSKLQIDGIAAIQMKMADDVDPVEVGKNAVYRLTLTNTGSAPATKIVVKGTASDILDIVDATGPTKGAVAGKVVTFGVVDMLQPNQKIVFTFQCKALKTGDARFRVEYTSNLNETPIREEEPTMLVPPLANPVPGAPMGAIPPPPGGGVPMPLPKN